MELNGDQCLNVGIVGMGYWGPNLLRVLLDHDDVRVGAICDLDEDRLERFGRRTPEALRTTRADDIFEDRSIDAVLIATPVFTHHRLASQSLLAGKHTFVEKPLAASTAAAEELFRIAGGRGLYLMCGHTFIYSPPVQAVKHMLDIGELGELFFISSSRVNLGLHQRDVSVVWDLGPHDFSILLHWLGEMPVSVRAVGRDSIVQGISDVAFVTLEFPSGVVAHVELSWIAPSKLRRTLVVGREKMVVYEDGSPESIKLFNHGVVYEDPETFGEYHLSYRTGDIVSPKLDTSEPLAEEISDFIKVIQHGGALRSDAELARNVVRVTEAADESLRRGGKEIRLRQKPLFESLQPREDVLSDGSVVERRESPHGRRSTDRAVRRTAPLR